MAVAVPVSLSTGRIVVECEGGVGLLRMVGEIDADCIAAYEAEPPSADGPVFQAVDLSGVTYLSSSGIGFLLRQTRRTREQGEIPVLRGASTSARRILTLAGVADLFHSAG